MSSPERIRPTLDLVALLWRKYPDLRLGQLLLNLGACSLWNLEDEELMSRILTVSMYGWDRLYELDKTRDAIQAGNAS